jgi:hypothetical protein
MRLCLKIVPFVFTVALIHPPVPSQPSVGPYPPAIPQTLHGAADPHLSYGGQCTLIGIRVFTYLERPSPSVTIGDSSLRGLLMPLTAYDIFKKEDDALVWVEPAEDLESAKKRLEQLVKLTSREHVIFDHSRKLIVASLNPSLHSRGKHP